MTTPSDTTTDATPLVFDATDATFTADVIERSHTTPVVVDLWAAWCGPCRTLGPMLERAVADRGGDVVLAKVDVDANPGVSQAFRVQSIPAVFGLRDGKVVSQFVGVRPEPEIAAFLDALTPSAADRAVRDALGLDDDAREAGLRAALTLEPGHREAALALADLVVERDPDEAVTLVTPHRPLPAAETLLARADLVRRGGQTDAGALATLRAAVTDAPDDGAAHVALGEALAATGAHDEAIEHLLTAVEIGGEPREAARHQLVTLFDVLGDDPRVDAARRRLARALF